MPNSVSRTDIAPGSFLTTEFSAASREPKIKDTMSSSIPPELPFHSRERPKLPPPSDSSTLPDLRLLSLMNQFRNLGDQFLKLQTERLAAHKDHLEAAAIENTRRLKESAERAQSSEFWSLLQRIATSILSAVSIVTGIGFLATGGGALIGGAMIASGIFAIANLALQESGSWDWITKKLAEDNEERRRLLAQILPGVFGIASAALCIFGAVHAPLIFMGQIGQIAGTVLAAFQGTATVGKGVSDARLTFAQADLTKSSATMTVTNHRVEHTVQAIGDFLETLQAIQQQTARAIQSAMRSHQLAVQA